MLHFTSRAEWERSLAGDSYRPDAMAKDGFVHLSFGHQLARTATQLAGGQEGLDLVLLVVDPEGLEADLRVEGGFPHLYRPIPLSAVRIAVDFARRADGSHELPDPARLAELALTALPSFDAVLGRCRSVMAGFDRPWWIGGGWAVDAGTGSISRPHLDVDLVVLRPDAPALGRHFAMAGWDLRLARSGTLFEWDGKELAESDHQIWTRPDDGYRPERWQDFAADPGFVEILIEQLDADHRMWVYRRNPAVRAPLERLGAPTGFLRPEVALLYKAPAAAGDDPVVAAKAEADFDHAVGHLDDDQREWLSLAVELAHPEHHWLATLND